MSSNFVGQLGISNVILASAIALQSGAFFYIYRRFKRLHQNFDEILFDCSALRDELNFLKSRVNLLESQTKSGGQQISFATSSLNEQINPCYQFVSRVNSLASSGEFADAYEDWNTSDGKTLMTSSQSNGEKTAYLTNMDEIDDLHDKGEYGRCCELLKKLHQSDPQNVEILWRLARSCHNQGNSFDQKNPRRKELILEGHKYAMQAYNLDKKNFMVLKWAAVLSGGLTDYLGTKEKIQEGYNFKEYLDKGLAINPTEYSLLHMRGRFSYSVANLSWFERKIANTFFATPPSATVDDALADFLEVEKLRPGVWIENLLYIGRCYNAKGNKIEAVKHLKQASEIEPADDADREALEDVKKLLNSVSK